MNILAEVETIEQDVVDDTKALVASIGTFLMSEAQKVMAAAANTDFGTTVLNLMGAVQNKSVSGADKLTAVVTAIEKAATDFLSAGGWSGLFVAVKDFVAGVVQMLWPDFIKAFAPATAEPAAE